jgi:hypothetical protein
MERRQRRLGNPSRFALKAEVLPMHGFWKRMAFFPLFAAGCVEPAPEPIAASTVADNVPKAAPKQEPVSCTIKGEPTCQLGETPKITVMLTSRTDDGGAMSAVLKHDRRRQWSTTAADLRSAGLDMVDRLEEAVTEQLPAGKATKYVSVTVVEGGTHGGDPPRHHEQPSDRPLRTDEMNLVRDTALQELARRRKLVEEHFTALRAALKQLFPMEKVGGTP